MDDLIAAGRRPDSTWVTVTRGSHVGVAAAADFATTLRAWQLSLPFWSSFTGLTAAQLRGWWLPPLPPALPLFAAEGRSARISRPGVHVCRHNVLPPWTLVDGVRVPSAAETVLSCARDLGLLDVVLLGDAALQRADVTREELVEVSRLRRRGSPLLRRAIPLMHPDTQSIFESLLRILHVVCGVAVTPQSTLYASDGTFVARGDLLVSGTQTFHEYDGAHHRSAHQLRQDLLRDRRILGAGHRRRGYTSRDVLVTPLGILRDADATLGRTHDPSRIQAWYSLLQDSLFTPAGRRRLEVRLGLAAETADEIHR